MAQKRIEDQIRDSLASNLSIIAEDLTFLDKEKYLPSHLGTRSFIDILAKDSKGNFVIIELKRSDSSSRDALHEVLKYTESIKENLRANDDEIKIIIVSTEWNELIVPFSSFVKRTSCTVKGYYLQVDSKYKPIKAELVQPLPLEYDRLISPYHTIRLYTSKCNFLKGITSHKKSFDKKGVADYILVTLKAPVGFYDKTIQSVKSNLAQIDGLFGSKNPIPSPEELKGRMPNYTYMIYSAIQQLTPKQYIEILSSNQELLDEVMKDIEDYEEEEAVETLQDYALGCLKPLPYSEYIEIGYPAKFGNKILDEEGWELFEIIRSGAFRANELLTDKTIINELRGLQGNTGQLYTKEFESSHTAQLNKIKKDISHCLEYNTIWKNHILLIIDFWMKKAEENKFSGRMHVFNPSNFILSIYRAATEEKGVLYIPSYYIKISVLDQEEDYMYFGSMELENREPCFESILKKYYGNDVSQILLPLCWGGYENRDLEIMEDLGIKYNSFLCKTISGKQDFYKLKAYDFIPCEKTMPFDGFNIFLVSFPGFVQKVVSFFEKHDLGSFWVSENVKGS